MLSITSFKCGTRSQNQGVGAGGPGAPRRQKRSHHRSDVRDLHLRDHLPHPKVLAKNAVHPGLHVFRPVLRSHIGGPGAQQPLKPLLTQLSHKVGAINEPLAFEFQVLVQDGDVSTIQHGLHELRHLEPLLPKHMNIAGFGPSSEVEVQQPPGRIRIVNVADLQVRGECRRLLIQCGAALLPIRRRHPCGKLNDSHRCEDHRLAGLGQRGRHFESLARRQGMLQPNLIGQGPHSRFGFPAQHLGNIVVGNPRPRRVCLIGQPERDPHVFVVCQANPAVHRGRADRQLHLGVLRAAVLEGVVDGVVKDQAVQLLIEQHTLVLHADLDVSACGDLIHQRAQLDRLQRGLVAPAFELDVRLSVPTRAHPPPQCGHRQTQVAD
mmetsp:Transcript_21513/g.35694  ORF Transcript_21513/g.35694 Transcript_21513/m.35694 type:complete len:379 (-) Transcript_21513:898-2034(-)